MNWLASVFLALAVALHPSSATINSSFVIDVIRQLDSAFHFATLSVFSEVSLDHTEDSITDLPQKLGQEARWPLMNFMDISTDELRYTFNRNSHLSVVLAEQIQTNVMKIAKARLRGMCLSKMIWVLRHPAELEQLNYFLNWLWDAQFANILVLFESTVTQQAQIFTLDPYPTLKWVNRTDESDPNKLFVEKTKDLKQYRIETPFVEDVPGVLLLHKNGETKIVGRRGNLMKAFAKYMNISLICNYMQNVDLEQILRDFQTSDIELSVHVYSTLELEKTGSSYPLETVRWCIMVPIRSEVPKSEYVIIAFDWATWLVTCFSVVYIGILMRFVSPQTAHARKLYFLRSLSILMYSPNMTERMQQPTYCQFFFYGLVFLLGFILSCIYSTYLTSFCTNMVFQPPIDTVEDLIKDNLRVMVIDYELEAIRRRAAYGETFLKILYPVSYFEVISRRAHLDGQYAYSIREDQWHFLDKQQRGLKKPLFRLSNICFGRHHSMYPLQVDSHLQTHLDLFILTVMQAGLDLFWDEEAFRMAVAMKHSKVLVEQTVIIQQLRLDYFKYVYAVWAIGIVLSAICFAGEVLWMKFITVKEALQRIKELEERG